MIYPSQRFKLWELVSPLTYHAWGERAWEFIDPRLMITLDQMVGRYGPIVVNDWHEGAALKGCGLRDFADASGAAMSQHKFGRAADCHPRKVTPQEMHADILAHPEEFPELRVLEAIESTPSWVHADVRQHAQSQQIWVVHPNP